VEYEFSHFENDEDSDDDDSSVDFADEDADMVDGAAADSVD
jgi:hypothetical protein